MYLEHKGINIFYTDEGKGNTIVLLHGFLENALFGNFAKNLLIRQWVICVKSCVKITFFDLRKPCEKTVSAHGHLGARNIQPYSAVFAGKCAPKKKTQKKSDCEKNFFYKVEIRRA